MLWSGSGLHESECAHQPWAQLGMWHKARSYYLRAWGNSSLPFPLGPGFPHLSMKTSLPSPSSNTTIYLMTLVSCPTLPISLLTSPISSNCHLHVSDCRLQTPRPQYHIFNLGALTAVRSLHVQMGTANAILCCACMHTQVALVCVPLFVNRQTVAHQAPLSMGFSRQEC